MRALEIKKRRKELGFSQPELAEKLGVSVKTISNYENGAVIPITKEVLLLQILSNKEEELHPKTSQNLSIISTGYEGKINQLKERIYEHQEICFLLLDDPVGYSHQKEIIRLLEIQISLVEKARKDKLNDPTS